MKKILRTYILLGLILIGGATPCTTQCDGAGLWLWEKLQVCSTWIVLTQVIDWFVENRIHKDNQNKPANNSKNFDTEKTSRQNEKLTHNATINRHGGIRNFIWNNFPFNRRQIAQGGIAAFCIMSWIENLLHSTPEAPQQNEPVQRVSG